MSIFEDAASHGNYYKLLKMDIFSHTTRVKRRNLIIVSCLLLLTYTYKTTFKNPFMEGWDKLPNELTYGVLQIVLFYYLLMFGIRALNEVSAHRFMQYSTNIGKFHNNVEGMLTALHNINNSFYKLTGEIKMFMENKDNGSLSENGKIITENIEKTSNQAIRLFKDQEWWGIGVFKEARKAKRKIAIQNKVTLFQYWGLEIGLPLLLACLALYKTAWGKPALTVLKKVFES